MGIWDLTFKRLLRLRPQDLLGLVPSVPRRGRLRLLEAEFPPPAGTKLLDGCVELEADAGGTLYHVEFEAAPRGDTGLRVFEHYALAHCGHGGRPVRPVVFYLTPGAERRRPAQVYCARADGRLVCDFRFEAVRLWDLDADDLLDRPAPALWAVVALARHARLGHVRRACAQLGRRVSGSRVRAELLGVLYAVAGTRFAPRRVRALIPREVLMQSATVEELLREGEAKGLAAGRAEGEARGKANALLAVFAARELPVTPAQHRRLRACTDLEMLDHWIAAAVTAASVKEVLGGPRRRRGRSQPPGRPRTTARGR